MTLVVGVGYPSRYCRCRSRAIHTDRLRDRTSRSDHSMVLVEMVSTTDCIAIHLIVFIGIDLLAIAPIFKYVQCKCHGWLVLNLFHAGGFDMRLTFKSVGSA